METLFDLVLVAAALYGAKAYLTAPEVVTDREIFSSRGSMFVKRLVSEQAGQGRQGQAITLAPRSEPPLAEPEPSPGIIAEAEPTLPAESDMPTDLTAPAAARDSGPAPVFAEAEFQVPQDSVLNRHYWAQRAAERAAIEQPYPTDSVLLRHFRQKQAAGLQLPVQAADADSAAEPVAAEQSISGAAAAVPEDSVLKRHFLANARNLVEQNCGPRPSDSVLCRHHRQLVEAAVADYLAGLA